jgi:hypothetical protein
MRRETIMAAIRQIAGGFLLVGGGILLLHTLFGMVASLILGFDSILAVMTFLSLTLAFPIYLIGIKSLRTATWLLWAFFAFQWLNECLLGNPPRLVNPFDWWRGDTLFASIVFVHVGYLLLYMVSKKGAAINLRDYIDVLS